MSHPEHQHQSRAIQVSPRSRSTTTTTATATTTTTPIYRLRNPITNNKRQHLGCTVRLPRYRAARCLDKQLLDILLCHICVIMTNKRERDRKPRLQSIIAANYSSTSPSRRDNNKKRQAHNNNTCYSCTPAESPPPYRIIQLLTRIQREQEAQIRRRQRGTSRDREGEVERQIDR